MLVLIISSNIDSKHKPSGVVPQGLRYLNSCWILENLSFLLSYAINISGWHILVSCWILLYEITTSKLVVIEAALAIATAEVCVCSHLEPPIDELASIEMWTSAGLCLSIVIWSNTFVLPIPNSCNKRPDILPFFIRGLIKLLSSFLSLSFLPNTVPNTIPFLIYTSFLSAAQS